MTFAQTLANYRSRLGWTQKEIAEFLEIPDRTYWEWEKGKTEPPAIAQEGAVARLEKLEETK